MRATPRLSSWTGARDRVAGLAPVLALGLVAAAARPAGAGPSDVVGRPLVLAPGQVAAALTAEVELAPGEVAHPTSLAPDVWWGLARRWTVGILHSHPSLDRFEAGASLCVTGGCPHPYRGGGLDVRFAARTGALAVAPRVRLVVRDVDPWKPAVLLGATARWHAGRVALATDPYLQLGLANRDRGNRAALVVPLVVTVQPTCRWALALHTGWNGDLAVWRDGWHVPVGLGVRARATAHVDVGALLGFASLLGPQNTPKARALFLSVGWRS